MPIQNPQITDPKAYFEYLCQLHINYAASDAYYTYGEIPILRASNQLYRLIGLDVLDDTMLLGMTNVILTEKEKEIFNQQLSIDIAAEVHGRRFRINISKASGHLMIVTRLFAEKVPTLDELNMSPVLKTLTHRTNGIIFVAGPTGSGKSTTLAAMIEEVNTNYPKHILTIEDPIEYVFSPKKALIRQKQLGKDIVSFSSAMKYALRQRPDVILFGEARDQDGIRNAIALAETGHLVLTTIHARSATEALQKIISMFPAQEQSQVRNQLASSLTAIIIQKLAKRKDNGMVPVQEILLNNIAVENTIRDDKLNQIENIIYGNRTIGMQLLEDHLLYLHEKGHIDANTAISLANNVEKIKTAIQQ